MGRRRHARLCSSSRHAVNLSVGFDRTQFPGLVDILPIRMGIPGSDVLKTTVLTLHSPADLL
jgi:hypothetical protein